MLRRPALLALALVVVAIGARLVAQLVLGFYEQPEAFEHDEIARNLVAGRGYELVHNGAIFHVFASPAYAFALAAAYVALGVAPLAPGVLQLGLGAALAVTVWALFRRIGGDIVGALAGLGAATHPGLLVFAAKIQPLNLDAPLAAATVLLLARFNELPSTKRALALGIVSGLDGLSRPTLLAFVVPSALVFLAWSPDRRRAFGALAVAAVAAAALVGPWVARNVAVVGRPVLATGVGEVFWIGNNPRATGGALTEDGRPILDGDPIRDLVWARPELEQDDLFWRAAFSYVAEDPARTVRADVGKFGAFWWWASRTGALYPPQWLQPYTLYYLAVLSLAALGAMVLVRRPAPYELLVLALAGVLVPLVQSLFFVEGRHRWEIEALLVGVAAAGVVAIARGYRRRGAS